MFSQKHRIKKSREIERIFKKGKSFKQDLLVLKRLKNSLSVNRFAFVVSQKVSKKANIRNRVKRKLREAVRSKASSLKPGFDNLFIVLPGLEKKSFKEIEQMVESLLERIKE